MKKQLLLIVAPLFFSTAILAAETSILSSESWGPGCPGNAQPQVSLVSKGNESFSPLMSYESFPVLKGAFIPKNTVIATPNGALNDGIYRNCVTQLSLVVPAGKFIRVRSVDGQMEARHLNADQVARLDLQVAVGGFRSERFRLESPSEGGTFFLPAPEALGTGFCSASGLVSTLRLFTSTRISHSYVGESEAEVSLKSASLHFELADCP